jgi:hypothetical protein
MGVKEIEIARKRNIELSKENDELKFKLEKDKTLNQESTKKANELIDEFVVLKQEWEKAIYDLKEKSYEYQELLDECKSAKEELLKLKDKIKQ